MKPTEARRGGSGSMAVTVPSCSCIDADGSPAFIGTDRVTVIPNTPLAPPDEYLAKHAEFLIVRAREGAPPTIVLHAESTSVDVYWLSDEPTFAEDDHQRGGGPLSHQTILPSRMLHGLWDSYAYANAVCIGSVC